jgi:hypothetical protein
MQLFYLIVAKRRAKIEKNGHKKPCSAATILSIRNSIIFLERKIPE